MSDKRIPAVVLLSGGLDSSTVLALASAEGHECHCVSFHYGQRHTLELELAARQAELQGAASHRVIHLDPDAFAASSLTSGMGEVPKHRSDEEIEHGIPTTYVPARNTVFLSYALGMAEVIGARDIWLGVNAVDYSGYPDCRPEFIKAFVKLANLATREGVEHPEPWFRVHAPLMHMNKTEIIRTGLERGVEYASTSTCYDPSPEGRPCEACDACHLRMKAFESLGITDPALAH